MSLLKSFFGGGQQVDTKSASAVDVVTYIASLASEPQAMDTLLDPLREITSRIQPGQALSATDQTTLAEVCKKLEKHLVEQDPLRNFDKATLDTKIAQKFSKPNAGEATFWQKLKEQ